MTSFAFAGTPEPRQSEFMKHLLRQIAICLLAQNKRGAVLFCLALQPALDRSV